MLKECGTDVRRNRAKSPNVTSARTNDSNKSPGRRRKSRPSTQPTVSHANVLVNHYSSRAQMQTGPASNEFMNFPSEYQVDTHHNSGDILPPAKSH